MSVNFGMYACEFNTFLLNFFNNIFSLLVNQLINLGTYCLDLCMIKFRNFNFIISDFIIIRNCLKIRKIQFSVWFYFFMELLIISRTDPLFPKSTFGNELITLCDEKTTKCLFEDLSPMSM